MVVRTGAGKHLETGILGSERLKPRPDLLLAHSGRKVIFSFMYEFLRDIGIKLIDRAHAYPFQHHLNILLGMGEIGECTHAIRLFLRKRQRP